MKTTDKMRIDWLNKRNGSTGVMAARHKNTFTVWCGKSLSDGAGQGTTLRKAIDAAMKAERNK